MSHNVCNVKTAPWKCSVNFIINSDDDSEYHTVSAFVNTYEKAIEWIMKRINAFFSSDKIYLSSAIEVVDGSIDDDVDSI